MNRRLSKVGAGLRGFAGALASVVFPAPCRICGEMLDNASRIPICRACLKSLDRYAGPMCERCGRPFLSQTFASEASVSDVASDGVAPPLCHICRRGLYDFDFARSYGLYAPRMAQAVILLKYHGVSPLGTWFAKHLETLVRADAAMFAADIVVPVPVHTARLKERGYNQAELIARPLARSLGIACQTDLLVRTKPRPDKLKLTLRERWRTVRGAYATRAGARVDNLRVLLLDDVLTTGATLDACSRVLRRAGARSVTAVTVARAVPGRELPGPPAMEPDE